MVPVSPLPTSHFDFYLLLFNPLGSRVVSALASNRSRVTVLGKLFTPIVPLFTKQQN